jgi:polyisoprenoid-binding protein YceI
MKNLLHAILLLAALSSSAFAQAQRWEIDTAHSTVGFSVRHMTVSNVSGAFTAFTGSVDVDPADPASAKVQAEIDTASVNTGNEKRDAHLRNEDFFDAPKNPKITFVSKKIEKAGEGLKMTGDLTMHGVTKEVTLDVEAPSDAITDQKGNQRRGVSATGKLDRKEFGLNWSKTLDSGGLVVGNEIKLKIDLELISKAAPAASPAPSPEAKN